MVAYPYLLQKKDEAYDNIGFVIYNNSILNDLDIVDENDVPDDNDDNGNDNDSNDNKPKENNQTSEKSKYIGTIEISKINLKKGFVDPSSKYNNIKYNVTIMKPFDYPDVKNGNFVLAAHSGSGPIAFFKDLYKLKTGDTVKISYNSQDYVYKIVDIYYQVKQGYVEIHRNGKKNTLTLITCTKNNKKSQTVYIAELI